MTSIDDFFGAAKPDGPPRDRYGRPLLLPRGAQDPDRLPYTRASSLADYLDDFAHLWKWKMRYLARSLGQNPDLAALAGAENYTTGFDKGDEKDNRMSGRRLDEVIERALDRQGISVKADYGTVVHAMTEPGHDGNAGWYQNAEKDAESFWDYCKRQGIVLLGTELFTANDRLMVSGTFDHLAFVPGYGICIVDKKTSSSVHGESFRIQLATYAGADLYDWETDERTTLEDYVTSLGWDPSLINRKDGFIAWIKDGRTEFHRLDLVAGLEAALHATWVRDFHRKGQHSWLVDDQIADTRAAEERRLLDLVAGAPTVDFILSLWSNPEYKALWTPAVAAAATARREEIERV